MSTLDEETDDEIGNYYDYRSTSVGRWYDARSGNWTLKMNDSSAATTYRVASTILLRAGFLLVQIGSVPVVNVNLILLQNIVDFSAVTTASILIGSSLAFAGDTAGLIGEGVSIREGRSDANDALLGWSAAMTASAICTCCTVGRMHAVGYLLSGILISGLVQPLMIHWAWTPRGWMADNSLAGRAVSFADYGGGITVHALGSLAGFLGCLILGRRILRLRDLDESSLPVDSPGITFAGYLLILLGLQGIGAPLIRGQTTSEQSFRRITSSKILTNNLLAGSSSSLLVVVLHFALSREPFDHWTVIRCVQGSISGIAAAAPGLDVYSPLVTVAVGCSNGLIFYLVSRRVYRSALEDYCNAVATHLTSPLFGSFLAPLCAGAKNIGRGLVIDAAWQVVCIIASLLLVTAAMGTLFSLLGACGFLRNRSESINNRRATLALERGPPRSFMQRLFFPGTADSLYLQPGSTGAADVGGIARITGQRFARYEREFARLEDGGPTRQERETTTSGRPKADPVTDGASNYPATPFTGNVERRVKKPRQIYTLAKDDRPPTEVADVEGAGESTYANVDRFEPSSTIDGENYSNADEIGKFDSRESLERIPGGDETSADYSPVKFHHELHRTTKFLGLRTDKRFDSSHHSPTKKEEEEEEEEEHCRPDDGRTTRGQDFTVKVLLEPRRKSINISSDSEEEKIIGGRHYSSTIL